MKKTALISALLFATPLIAFAQGANNLRDLILMAGSLLNLVIPVLIALALVIFFWGLIQYIRDPGKGHEQGRKVMIAGLLSLFIMVSVFGIIRLAQNTLLGGSHPTPVPLPLVQPNYAQ